MSRRLSVTYLKRQLRADPLTSAERIITSRNSELGLTKPNNSNRGPTTTNATGESSAVTQARLDHIREKFWSMPQAELEQELQSIDARRYPELATAVQRLLQAASIRADFSILAMRLKSDSAFFDCLKQSITLSPRDAAGMKEAILRNLLQGADLKAFKAAAQIVCKEFPNIYQLDPEWFDQLQSVRKQGKRLVDDQRSAVAYVSKWILVLLFIALVRGCGTLMR